MAKNPEPVDITESPKPWAESYETPLARTRTGQGAREFFDLAPSIVECNRETPDVGSRYRRGILVAGVCDASDGALETELPDVVTFSGTLLTVTKSDESVHAVTVVPRAGQEISGYDSITLSTKGDCVTMYADRSNDMWRIM